VRADPGAMPIAHDHFRHSPSPNPLTREVHPTREAHPISRRARIQGHPVDG
jgi:hypothetical protein